MCRPLEVLCLFGPWTSLLRLKLHHDTGPQHDPYASLSTLKNANTEDRYSNVSIHVNKIGPTSRSKGAKDRVERNGIDWVHQVSTSLAPPVALEGILPALHLLIVIKILHCYSALNRAKGITSAIGIAAYAARLILER